MVPGCECSNETYVLERGQIHCVSDVGHQGERKAFSVSDESILNKEILKVKPGNWACVQARELWSTREEVHFRPGHHWLCWETQVTARAAKRSSSWDLEGGRITRGHLIETKTGEEKEKTSRLREVCLPLLIFMLEP